MARLDVEHKARRVAWIALVCGVTGLLWIMHRPTRPGYLPVLLVLLTPILWSLACGMMAAARGRNRTLWTILGGSYELLAFIFLASRSQRVDTDTERESLRLRRYRHKLK